MSSSVLPPPRVSGVAFVTGAGGFIGRHAVSAMRRAGWATAGLSNSAAPADGLDLPPADAWVSGAISGEGLQRAMDKLGTPEVIIHAAGGSSVAASLADPDADHERTVGSVAQVLDFMRTGAPGARLIFLSSAAVYGQAGPDRLDEAAAAAPISPYGRNKRAAEELIEARRAEHGLDAVVVRFFSVYGEGLRKQIFWELSRRLASDPAALELGGTGEERRDFLHVEEATDFLARLAAAPAGALPPLVNGGGGRATTVREAAEALARALGCDTGLRFSGETRPGDPQSLVADPALALALGLEPRIGLDEGLARFAAWARPLLEPAHG